MMSKDEISDNFVKRIYEAYADYANKSPFWTPEMYVAIINIF
jgi:hypothetical protein